MNGEVNFTELGNLQLSNEELKYLDDLLDGGDRGAFHIVYGLMSDNEDAILTTKISTFSDTIGGIAFAANSILQQDNPASYQGIYFLSQEVAKSIYRTIEENR